MEWETSCIFVFDDNMTYVVNIDDTICSVHFIWFQTDIYPIAMWRSSLA